MLPDTSPRKPTETAAASVNHSDSIAPSTATQSPSPFRLATGDVAAIVVAAGRGQRFGSSENKVLLPLGGIPIWIRAIEALRCCDWIGDIVLVVRDCDRPAIEAPAKSLGISVVVGGAERIDSVRAGLQWLATGSDPARWIAVHDAARPLVPPDDIEAVICAAVAHHAAILATPVRGTLKRGRDDRGAISTVDRTDLWEALTPQVFSAAVLRRAYDRHRGRPATDDAELVERSGAPVCLVPGSAENLKITRAEDLQIAEAILSRRTTPKD